MPQTKQLKGKGETLTPIEDFATAWGVSTKTVQNWVEFTYQAFEILMPSSGPFPDWAVELLTLCAKHVSQKASLYFAETGESRRLRGTEYVTKIRKLRSEGHFQQFQNLQKFQNVHPEENPVDELEDDALAEVGAIVRGDDLELSQIRQTIEAREDQDIEALAQFIEDSPQRKMSKLVRRLQTGRSPNAALPSIGEAVDVAYKQLPSQD